VFDSLRERVGGRKEGRVGGMVGARMNNVDERLRERGIRVFFERVGGGR